MATGFWTIFFLTELNCYKTNYIRLFHYFFRKYILLFFSYSLKQNKNNFVFVVIILQFFKVKVPNFFNKVSQPRANFQSRKNARKSSNRTLCKNLTVYILKFVSHFFLIDQWRSKTLNFSEFFRKSELITIIYDNIKFFFKM